MEIVNRIADIHGMSHVEAMDHQSPRRKVGRELLAIAAIASIAIVYLGMNWETRPPSFMTGRVASFGLVEQEGYGQLGSIVRAQVDLPKNLVVSISLPNGALCRVGSQIEIQEAHTLFGSRFKTGLRECSTSAFRDTKSKSSLP